MDVLVLGSTGMVGKGVLLECLDDPRVSKVLVINRRPLGLVHAKLQEILHVDFNDFSAIRSRLTGVDACFFCLGVSAAGKDQATYTRLTYDLTIQFAKELVIQSPNAVFCYVSGAGTDSSEHGRTMWARVKGRTENALLGLGFRASYMFRPGYIQPMRGVKSTIGWYNTFYSVLKPIYFMFRPFKRFTTDSITLGKAMINVAANGYGKSILESLDINNVGSRQQL